MAGEERVLRGLRQEGVDRSHDFLASGLADRLVAAGKLVATSNVSCELTGQQGREFRQLLEHERIALITYPYEWPFELLQAAALLHLDVHVDALADGFTLIDASAYNIQFRGPDPVFIDVLSFRRYVDGELWAGHRQFCEQFLNPLLLQSVLGVPHNAWFRGALEGIDLESMAALLPARCWLSPRALIHVLLPARSQRRMTARTEQRAIRSIRAARLPRHRLKALLVQLREWIASLERPGSKTLWADYGATRTYDAAELAAKRAFVAEFCAATRPGQLLDLGCNDGEFLELALGSGARFGIGLDADHGALARAFARARRRRLNMTPLYFDAANPSPGQGWRQQERQPIEQRARPDAVIALAFEHHLAIGRNIPLPEVVGFIAQLAPRGVVEFVQKDDPTVQRMIALKGDLFAGYDESAFRAALEREAKIVRRTVISRTGRTLYWFER